MVVLHLCRFCQKVNMMGITTSSISSIISNSSSYGSSSTTTIAIAIPSTSSTNSIR